MPEEGGRPAEDGQSDGAGRVSEKGQSNASGQPPENAGPVAIVAHGGVIRSILSYITDTPLINSFKVFSLHYGCVIRLFGETEPLQYEFLSNLPPEEKEQHKPKSFY